MALKRFIASLIASIVGIILTLPVLLFLLPVWLVSLILKIAKKFRPQVLDWKDTNLFDQELGWKPKPGINAFLETDGVNRVTTGKDGWRGSYNLNKSSVIAIGDSFVFGKGASDNDHFARFTTKATVKPIGASGYGATHYLLLLKSLTKELQGKLVVWFVYTGNDYKESIRPSSYGKRAPFTFYNQTTKEWGIKTNYAESGNLPFNFERTYRIASQELADLFSKNFLSDYSFGAFEYLAKEAKKHCDSNKARFAIVTIPLKWMVTGEYTHKIKRYALNQSEFSLDYPDEQIAQICKRNGIFFKPGFREFLPEDFLQNDLHWSRKGNEKVANILDELYTSVK